MGKSITMVGIIDRWHRQVDLAADCRVEPPVVTKWRKRNRIPAEYFPAMLEGAKNRDIGLTADDLIRAAAGSEKRKRSKAEVE